MFDFASRSQEIAANQSRDSLSTSSRDVAKNNMFRLSVYCDLISRCVSQGEGKLPSTRRPHVMNPCCVIEI